MAGPSKYKKLAIELPHGTLAVYAGQKTRNALHELQAGLDVYLGTRLQIVLAAVYDAGQKDGRKELVDQLEAIRKKTNYLPPGRPKK
ncbi:MAG: hypothetical protein WBE38_13615 [Terracidiphilus sp.]